MENVERFISSGKKEVDRELERTLRPQKLDDYIGQGKIKEKIKIYLEAAKKRGEPIDHMLFYGPPGLGKTTLAHIIASEMRGQLKITSGPAIERSADLCAILSNLNTGDVLFIDEIHRLNKNIEEVLYPALEDFALDFVVGKGPSASSIRITLNRFTLIGATTKAGEISAPLRDRFGIVERLELYDKEDLKKIILRSSRILGLDIGENIAAILAQRSRGTPRVANRLVKRLRDFGQVFADGKKIDEKLALFAMEKLEIDDLGLDFTDRVMLEAMMKKFGGGPVGLASIASAINEEVSTLEDVYEPYLMQLGFIARTPRGRLCMEAAYKHLGIKYDENKQE